MSFLPSAGNLPLLSDSEIAFESSVAAAEAAGYSSVGDAVLYGASLVGGSASVLGLASVPFSDLAARARQQLSDAYRTPERPSTPPPRITPSKRSRIEEEPLSESKMPASGAMLYSSRGNKWGKKYGTRRYKSKRNFKYTMAHRRLQNTFTAYPTRMIRTPIAENKYIDINATGTFSAAAWVYVTLMGLTQGTTANTRLGNKIFVRSIQIKGYMKCTGGAGGAYGNVCRTVMFHDKQANGALPGATPSIFANDVVNSLRYPPGNPRYRILKDDVHRVFAFQATGGVADASVPNVVNWYVPINHHVTYGGNLGTVADLTADNFGLGFIAQNAASCTYDYRIRVNFSDA